MRNRRRLLLDDAEPENFWPSFTDLTSTIALILFVLVLLAYIQNLISGKNLAVVKSELARTLERLQGSQQQITSSQRRLRLLAAEIEAGQAQLKLSEQHVEQQQEVIADSNRQLDELRARLRGIAVFRLEVLEKVKSALEAQLHGLGSSVPLVSIGDNGNIVIDESLLFEYDSATIKRDGRPFLDTLARAFAGVLDDPAVRENIEVVLVQGHTDERGTVAYNRELSGKRANAVLSYMFEANRTLEGDYGRTSHRAHTRSSARSSSAIRKQRIAATDASRSRLWSRTPKFGRRLTSTCAASIQRLTGRMHRLEALPVEPMRSALATVRTSLKDKALCVPGARRPESLVRISRLDEDRSLLVFLVALLPARAGAARGTSSRGLARSPRRCDHCGR
jgi:chemotaxis protein MotB